MVVPLAVFLLLGIGIFDYVTGADVTFVTLLYLFPVTLGTWMQSRRAGLWVAVLAISLQCVVVFGTQQPHSISSAISNQAAALGVLVFVVFSLDSLHVLVRHAQEGRALALNQLRHSERLNTIGTLSAGVAHELGTPMNVILGRAKIIGNHAAGSTIIEENARIIVEQTERMTRIIQQLLDFSRSKIGVKGKSDLVLIAQQSIKLLQESVEDKQISLCLEAKEPVFADVDKSQILQVILNIVMNAIHATPAHGAIDLRIDTALSAKESGHEVQHFARVEIVDRGAGMSEETQTRLFEPFYTTKEVGAGTGLGLSVAHGIVKEHGGWIQVTTKLGQGSRFAIYLPMVKES